MPKPIGIIPCELSQETKKIIQDYTDALQKAAAGIGNHGLSKDDFWKAGIFRSAIEKIRGTQAATMDEKKSFVKSILDQLKISKLIVDWSFHGSGERHDYEVKLKNGKLCIIETKGCLDGNNTNIFRRPPNADEFVIWSLCQNPGADPKKNAWSGIHTRLSAEIISEKQRVDGLIIWDMICGTKGRPCPKLINGKIEPTSVGRYKVPPPCIYLFPHTLPDPRNNPTPKPWNLKEVSFLQALGKAFKTGEKDAIKVHIETRMDGPHVERRTKYFKQSVCLQESNWTRLKRAK